MIAREDGTVNHGTRMAGCLLLAFAAGAEAQGTGSEDGCTVLGELVEASVRAAATQYELTPAGLEGAVGARVDGRGGRVASTVAGRQVCGATVETVTRAFSRGMAALDLSVSWNFPPQPGGYCWSGDLGRCYPSADPMMPGPAPARLAFVYDAWNGVSRAVASRMPRGTGGGLSAYTEASLAEALSLHLARSVHGPLYEAYGDGGVMRSR